MPSAARRASSAIDQFGSTVEHMTNTLPRFMAAAQPPAPNSTLSVCAALTTTDTMTLHCAASSAGDAQATPPSAAKACAASPRTSKHGPGCHGGAASAPCHCPWPPGRLHLRLMSFVGFLHLKISLAAPCLPPYFIWFHTNFESTQHPGLPDI